MLTLICSRCIDCRVTDIFMSRGGDRIQFSPKRRSVNDVLEFKYLIDSDDTPSATTRVTINHHCLPAILYLYFNP